MVSAGQQATPLPWYSDNVWHYVPALAAATEDGLVRQQLMVSFDNCICLAPSRKDIPSGDPKMPDIHHMVYKELHLDPPLAKLAPSFTVPTQYNQDSWRVPQKGERCGHWIYLRYDLWLQDLQAGGSQTYTAAHLGVRGSLGLGPRNGGMLQ